MLAMFTCLEYFDLIVKFAGVGYFTAIVQKLVVKNLKNNVELEKGRLFLECSVVIATVVYEIFKLSEPRNPLISRSCTDYVDLTADQTDRIDYIFAILSKTQSELNF